MTEHEVAEIRKSSPIYCEHANECPTVCPCNSGCWCRQPGRMCDPVHKPIWGDSRNKERRPTAGETPAPPSIQGAHRVAGILTWRHRIVRAVAWVLGVEVVQEERPPDPWWVYQRLIYGEYHWSCAAHRNRPKAEKVFGPFDKDEATRQYASLSQRENRTVAV